MSCICPTKFPCCALTIVPDTLGPFSTTDTALPGLTVLNGDGGVAPFTFTFVSPDNGLAQLGMALTNRGLFVLTGQSLTAGSATVVVTVTDSTGKCTGQKTYTIVVL